MRIFVIAPALPQPGHTVRAISVVVREALRAFTDLGHEVVFQPLLPPESEQPIGATEPGTMLLPGLASPHDSVGASPGLLLRQSVSSDPARFYPSYALRGELARRVRDSGADAVLHLWCSAAFAAARIRLSPPVLAPPAGAPGGGRIPRRRR